MAAKDSTAHIGIAVGIIGTVIGLLGTVAGLAQLDPVRTFSCERASVLCKREHTLKLFKMSLISARPSALDQRPWNVVVPWSLLGPSSQTECISSAALANFLNERGAIMDAGQYVLALGEQNTPTASKWVFDPAPLDIAKPIRVAATDDLAIYLNSRYTPLVRDVQLTMDTTITDGYQQLPQHAVNRTLKLPEGSREHNVFCKLFLPYERGVYTTWFEFKDDVWGKDDPQKMTLSIEPTSPNVAK